MQSSIPREIKGKPRHLKRKQHSTKRQNPIERDCRRRRTACSSRFGNLQKFVLLKAGRKTCFDAQSFFIRLLSPSVTLTRSDFPFEVGNNPRNLSLGKVLKHVMNYANRSSFRPLEYSWVPGFWFLCAVRDELLSEKTARHWPQNNALRVKNLRTQARFMGYGRKEAQSISIINDTRPAVLHSER